MSLAPSEGTRALYLQNLQTIHNMDLEKLLVKYDTKISIDYQNVKSDIQIALELFKSLDPTYINMLPNAVVSEVNIAIIQFLQWLKDFDKFCQEQEATKDRYAQIVEKNVLIRQIEDLKSKQDEIMERLKTDYANWFDVISSVASFCTKVRTDYDALQKDAERTLKQLKKLNNIAMSDINNAKKEIYETLEAAKTAAAEVGVTQHTANFAQAAEECKKSKNLWLAANIVLGCAIIWYAHWAFWSCPIELKEPYFYSFLQAALPRFTGLVVLFYALATCTTNYKAQAHNYVINKNKQNALSTFETFVKSTEDEEIKNAVLLQTTKAIFSNTQTGYLKNESGEDPSTQIVEVVRNISKTIPK